jgi:DNA primase
MDFVEQVKSSIDIVNVVGEYVRLRKQGASSKYLGLCPFHSEKTPSFNVDASKQFYYCFGCQKGGDAFKFVMEIEAVTFFEALKSLADRYGIAMPKRAEYSDAETKLKSALYEMHEMAARLFENNLNSPAGAEARAYLDKRGLSKEIAAEFGLGLSDRGGQALVRRFEQHGFPREAIEASGLILKRNDGSGYYDRFRGRLMFPIQNETGKIIAFGGRAIAAGDEPKYLNSSETPLYRKSYVLYNLHRAKDGIRKQDRSILVEGYMDVIGVYAAGIKEVVASCGTALKDTQVRALRRHSSRIVVNFDPDAAGENATEKSVQMLLEEGMHVRILQLDEGLDPDEYIKKHGAERYRALVEKAGGYFHWLADRIRARYGAGDAEQRTEGFKALLPAIQRIPDKLERAAVANEMAEYLNVERSLVLEQFRGLPGARSAAPKRPEKPAVPALEQILLKALLADGAVRAAILPQLRGHAALERFATRRIFETLCGMEEPAGYAALEARLDDRDSALLASIVIADELGGETDSLEHAQQCLHSLATVNRDARKAELRTLIRSAERTGDMQEALRVAQELSQLERS